MIKHYGKNHIGKSSALVSSFLCLILTFTLSSCSSPFEIENSETASATTSIVTTTKTETTTEEPTTEKPLEFEKKRISFSENMSALKTGLSYASFSGDTYFDVFLDGGGAKTDEEITNFLIGASVGQSINKLFSFKNKGSGCSTLSVYDDSVSLFGRNFDWKECKALILKVAPDKGYKSVSTVNTSFITSSTSFTLTDDILKFVSVYCPLDGMNEKGLCVSVNMAKNGQAVNQNTDKKDLTTSTALRLLLDSAATTQEAVAILEKYDMHSSFNYSVHFAISDKTGKSVAVEYVNNKMIVTETPVLTNHFVCSQGQNIDKTEGSLTRFNLLSDFVNGSSPSLAGVYDALVSVSANKSNEFSSTELSVIYDRNNLTALYFHRQNFTVGYEFRL